MRQGKIVGALCMLLWMTTAHAHLLNMTELHFDASGPDKAILRVKIDLGQSLLSPADYWRAVTADGPTQRSIIDSPVEQLRTGLHILINGERASAVLQSWTLDAASLEAIENSLSPQFATLTFELASPLLETPGALTNANLEVHVAETLEIPWPTLLRVDAASRQLPVSRLLTANDRSSRSISLGANADTADSSGLARLAVALQGWLPGLSWMAIGFQHIIPWGLDHIVFVLGLFFLHGCRRFSIRSAASRLRTH